jgi:hypothetical protein
MARRGTKRAPAKRTGKQTPAAVTRRGGRKLTPRGRQRFGEFLSNGLAALGAAVASITFVPAFTGSGSPSRAAVIGGIVAFVVAIALAIAVRYGTEEREGEET